MKNKPNSPKILVVGNARHGKDSVAEIFSEHFDFTYSSSSEAASKIFIFETLKDKYGYKTIEECFNDRVNHRSEWYDLICDYNKDDKAKLAKEILEISDAYIGMRDREEIDECIKQKLFDLIIWVDASDRLPLEDSSSFNIDKSCADVIIDNNSDLETLKKKVLRIGKIIFKKN